jgi:hypothetical protein
MSIRHSGKFSKTGGKCPIVMDIFLLFLKMGGKYPIVILANFHKWEENVRLSFWQFFKKGSKMSDSHSGKFSKTGGKCPIVILAIFQNREENVRL